MQGPPLIRVRWPAFLFVSGRMRHQLLLASSPRPCFYYAVADQVERHRPQVGVHISHLWLACPPDFFDVLERRLDGGTVGHHFQDRSSAYAGVHAQVRQRAARLSHQHQADRGPGGRSRRHERLDLFDYLVAVLLACQPLLAPLLPGTLSKVDMLLAVAGRRTALASPSLSQWKTQQLGIHAQPNEDDDSQSQYRLQKGRLE